MALTDASLVSCPATVFDTGKNTKGELRRWWSFSRHLKVRQRDKDPTDTVESAWQLFFKEVDDDDDENDDYVDVDDDDDVPR